MAQLKIAFPQRLQSREESAMLAARLKPCRFKMSETEPLPISGFLH